MTSRLRIFTTKNGCRETSLFLQFVFLTILQNIKHFHLINRIIKYFSKPDVKNNGLLKQCIKKLSMKAWVGVTEHT
jgi:hypothetical protein